MTFLIAIPIVAAVIFWLIGMVSWVASLQNLVDGVSLSSMFFNGMKAFDSDNFTPEGQRHQRRFLKAFGGFFVALFLCIAASIALEAQ